MGTKRRGEARGRKTHGKSRPAGRSPRNRLEKIPIPPVPAFMRSAARAPEKKTAGAPPGGDRQPGDDRLAEIISRNAISDAEADLLLGIGPEAEPVRSRPVPERPEAAAGGDPFATERPEGSLTQDEADDLLGLPPGPVMPPTGTVPGVVRREPTEATEGRSGASGATVLNELVDEIERDLGRDLDRHPPLVQSRRYGHTIGCWVSPLVGPALRHPKNSAGKRDEEEETA